MSLIDLATECNSYMSESIEITIDHTDIEMLIGCMRHEPKLDSFIQRIIKSQTKLLSTMVHELVRKPDLNTASMRMIKKLLYHMPDINSIHDQDNHTLLTYALSNINRELMPDIVHQLLIHKADPQINKKGDCPIFILLKGGINENSLIALYLLLKFGANPNCICNSNNNTPLTYILSNIKSNMIFDVLNLLLEYGAHPMGCSGNNNPLDIIIANHSGAIVEFVNIMAPYTVEPIKSLALCKLIELDNANMLNIAHELILCGASPNYCDSSNMSIIAGAIKRNTPASRMYIELLLTMGASRNYINPKNGRTDLMIAVAHNQIKLVKLLLDFGADPNMADRQSHTVLLHALDPVFPDQMTNINKRTNTFEIVEILLNSGANVLASNINHLTPIMAACKWNHHDIMSIVKLLISSGANVNTIDKAGYTPLMYAIKNPNEKSLDLAKLLIQSGADPLMHKSNGNILFAAIRSTTDAIEYAISLGADINYIDSDGRNALTFMFGQILNTDTEINNNDKLLKTYSLISYGVDVHIVDSNGKTAYDLAPSAKIKKFIKEYVLNRLMGPIIKHCHETGTECMICLSNHALNSILQCKHVFHYACIIKWSNENRGCPVCRQNIY